MTTASNGNPACAIMAKGCERPDCRFQAIDAWIEPAATRTPAASCYRYRCHCCACEWTVKYRQVQPVFDREGAIVEPPVIEVERVSIGT